MTATIDWCEPNYEVTDYIAEFWNTLSSLWIVFLGIYGAFKHQSWFRHLTFPIFEMFGFLSVVGVGSTLFHSHLTYQTQLADELPMLWMLLCANYILRNHIFDQNKLRRIPKFIFFSMCGYATGITLYIIWRWYIVFVIMFTLGLLELLYIKRNISLTDMASELTVKFTRYYVLAGGLWLGDHALCEMYGHLFLHVVWHILAGYATYFGCLTLLELYHVTHIRSGRSSKLRGYLLPWLEINVRPHNSLV